MPKQICMGHQTVNLFEILRELEGCARVKCLTCDLEIVLSLFYCPNISAGELFKRSGHSSTSFYATLKRLTQAGVLTAQVDPLDRRSNVYCLSESVRGDIEQRLARADFTPEPRAEHQSG